MLREEAERERRALHKAIQDIAREYENESVVVGCVLTFALATQDGGKQLCHRSFDVEGDFLDGWTAEGYLRDHLRAVDEQLKEGLQNATEDDD